MAAPNADRNPLRGIVLLILAVSLFAVLDGLSKVLADTQSVGQILVARYALALPVLLATYRPADWGGLFRTARPGLQIVRGIAPLLIGGCMVVAVSYLPLADATVILFAAPFLVVALSGPLLGERVRPASWIAVAIGFAAVLLVARPGFGDLSQYAIFPFAAAVFYALFQLLTRRLAAAGEKADTTLAWTLAVGLVVTTPIAVFAWPPLSDSAWILMIALGIVFGVSQALMVRAFAYASAGLLAPFGYVQIIAAVIFGLIVFHAVPDLWTLAGMVMITAAGVYVVRSPAD